MKMRIILFDIDGTIMMSGGAGRKAMTQSFQEVYGVADGLKEVVLSGRTDPLILSEALASKGIISDEKDKNRFKERYFELLAECIQMDLPGKNLFPGILEILQKLAKTDNVATGLLTGNWQQGAKTKLGYFNLYDFFPFGAFGDDSPDRNKLLPFAMERCNGNGVASDPTQAIVIGDTPMDIECAHVHGAKVMAVATGSFSYSELENHNPDWLFEDLSNVGEVLGILEG